MSKVPRWIGRLGAGLTEMGERLDERRAEVEKETSDAPSDGSPPVPAQTPDHVPPLPSTLPPSPPVPIPPWPCRGG
ncbi:hypothetical protein SAV31267_062180 [Streptomyces avermitilis]|uniref:Uncharacterized protein n=1 Tax=Streptomyces avermitilis TaxID=33903 RepID=A0A4D4MX72_STRAX|nr:hypothetical protein SAV31267_062180 [Streptomyces avermitilis]